MSRADANEVYELYAAARSAMRPNPFTPINLPNLGGWWDSSDIATITKDGSNKVSQWNDKSGNGRHWHQTNATFKPKWDASSFSAAYPGLNWTGNSLYFETSQFVIDFPWTCFFVQSVDADFLPLYNVIRNVSNSVETQDTTLYITSPSLEGNTFSNGPGLGIVALHSVFTRGSPDMSQWKINGLSQTLTSSSGTDPWSGQYPLDRMGCKIFGGDIINSGWFHEMVLCESDLDSTDEAKLYSYLANKWGLA